MIQLQELTREIFMHTDQPLVRSMYESFMCPQCRDDLGQRIPLTKISDHCDLSEKKLFDLQSDFKRLYFTDYHFRVDVDRFVASLALECKTRISQSLQGLIQNFEG